MRLSIPSAGARRRLSRSLAIALFAATVGVSGQNLSPTPVSQREGASEVERLEPGKPIRRNLAGSQAHDYRIALKAGQFLHLLVQQKGIDVVLTVSGPDGVKLGELDSPNGDFGPEPISLIAASDGDYIVRVAASEEKARTALYEINIEELRVPTARDQQRAAAQAVFFKAEALRAQGTGEARRSSSTLYREAADVWQAAADGAGEARALYALGMVQRQLGSMRESVSLLEQTLSIVRKLPDPGFEAATLTWLGVTRQRLGDSQNALALFEQALVLERGLGDLGLEGFTVGSLGQAQQFLGDHRAALESHRRMLAIARTLGSRGAEANALNNIAMAEAEVGELQKALDDLEAALKVHREVRDRRNEAIALNNIGLIYADREEWSRALEYHEQALPIRRETGDRYGEGYTLNNLGVTHWKLGESAKALEELSRALELRHEVGDKYGEAFSLQALGDVQLATRRGPDALASYEAALSIRREIADPRGEAETVASIARSLAEQGKLEIARQYSEKAVSLAEALRERIGPVWRGSYLGSARRYYELDIDLLLALHRKNSDPAFAALALEVSERARARSLVDLLREARADIRQGVEPGLLEREGALRRRLGSKLEERSRLLAGKHTAEQVAPIVREIDQASEQLEQLQSHIRELSPRYAALTAPRSLSVREVQALLDPQTVLLEYSLGEERSFAWAITSETFAVRELPRRSVIETLARRGYEELSRPRPRGRIELSSLPKLSNAVLAPVADLLDRERIVIAADGALQIVPFAALPAPRKNAPLLVDREVVSIPSASVLELLRSQPKHRTHLKLLAVIADPVFDREDPRVHARGRAIPAESSAESSLTRSILDLGGGVTRLPRLPFSRREAQALEALVPESGRKIVLDFRANRTEVTRGDLADYRFVHFATHGILDTVHPELSGLVFSLVDKQGEVQDGFLTAMEVFNLNLPAEMVVLSACQTGLGKEIRGEGIVGLTRAFMYAGAPRVVASLWRVDDAATAALMKRFYEGMLGAKKLRPAAALREAQLAVSRQKRWEDPYYWAGFVLQGEWR